MTKYVDEEECFNKGVWNCVPMTKQQWTSVVEQVLRQTDEE